MENMKITDEVLLYRELRIARIEKSIMFLNLMLSDGDCYNGFSKLCGRIIENTTPSSEERLYRGVLKQTIRDLEDLKGKISFGAVPAEYGDYITTNY